MKTNVLPETNTFVLDEEEIEIIQKHRAQKEAERKRMDSILKLLRVAYEYEQWLKENGRDTSFSTFVDEFGFQNEGGLISNLSWFYDRVNEMRQKAHNSFM